MRTSLLPAAVAGLLLAAGQVVSAPTAVPTFESLGLYWSPEGAQADRRASVRFKKSGTSGWLAGQDLVFDGRTAPSPPFSGAAEYRGSLVHLDAGTEYTVELTLEDGPTETFTASTWSENFPVGETVILPAESNWRTTCAP